MEGTGENSKKQSRGHASFAIPRAAIDALIDMQADAVTIGAYLTLACHTDKTGQFSTASLKAIRENLMVNRKRAEKAIQTLCNIQGKVANPVKTALSPRSRKKNAESQVAPLVSTRDTWLKLNGGDLPDGPHARAKVLHVLPTFNEDLKDRVWFGSGLVRGDDLIEKPLKRLKDCGNVAARLLLAMYAGQDMEQWGGVPPHGFPWQHYTLQEHPEGAIRVLSAKSNSCVGPTQLFSRIDVNKQSATNNTCFDAVTALQSCGLLYEAVVLLNRNPVPSKFSTGDAFGDVPRDADILCDLGSPSLYGPVSPAEQGIGQAYVQTVTDLNLLGSLPTDYDYLAVLPTGHPALICGLYRLRFRVTHDNNVFVKESKQRQLDANHQAFRALNYLRKSKKLDSLKYGSSTLQYSSIPLNSS